MTKKRFAILGADKNIFYKEIIFTEIFGEENVLTDKEIKPSLKFEELRNRKQDIIYLDGHGKVSDKQSVHECDIFYDEEITVNIIEKLQKISGTRHFVFTSCCAGQLRKDLANAKLNDGTKILILGSSKHFTFFYENMEFIAKVNQLYEKHPLEEIFIKLSKELGQTIQYVEFKDGKYFAAKRNSTDINSKIEFLLPDHDTSKKASKSDKNSRQKLFDNEINRLYKKFGGEDRRCRKNLAFIEAVKRNNTERVQHWLDEGANINFDDGVYPALHIAVANEDVEMVKKLTENKPNLNIQTKFGKTALHLAAENNDVDTIEFLLKHGANSRAQNKEGNTPLHTAGLYGMENSFNILTHHDKDSICLENKNKVRPFDLIKSFLKCCSDEKNIEQDTSLKQSDVESPPSTLHETNSTEAVLQETQQHYG